LNIYKENFVNKLRCPICLSGNIILRNDNAICESCSSRFPLLNGIIDFSNLQDKPDNLLSSQPKLFDKQKLYEFINFTVLGRLNPRTNIEINKYIKDKEVLDIGYGPRPYFYDPLLASFHTEIDISFTFLQRSADILPNSFFLKASADNLPFRDNSLDVLLFLFTLHHIPVDHAHLLKDAYRVVREIIIVFGHNQSLRGIKKFLKRTWWRLKDNGFQYNNQQEWAALLNQYTVKEKYILGKFLENVFEFIIIRNEK
jgi:ubiquinone/menaquinone biosynthesis C-methylase UbiE